MTIRLFDKDPYISEFDAQVVSCMKTAAVGKNTYEVILDETAFYPEGGGQDGDRGRIDSANVFDTQERDGQIIHFTDQPLEEGSRVRGSIDWENRFDLMQNHSGEHIVSGLVHET